MPRRAVEVDLELLQECLLEAESDGAFSKLGDLWDSTAEIYNNRRGDREKVTSSVVNLRTTNHNLTYKTTKGKRGRVEMSAEHKQKLMKARRNAKRVPKADKIKSSRKAQAAIEELRQKTPERFQSLVDRIEQGSRQAADKLHCLECTGYDAAEVRKCSDLGCPKWLFRPYQKKQTV